MSNSIHPSELIKEGTILITRRNPPPNIINKLMKQVHLAIAAKDNDELFIYDLNPDNRNNKNGNYDKRNLDEYLKGKDLIGIYHTGASSERIKNVAERCWRTRYGMRDFNCQKFIDDVTMRQFSSDLYSYYAGAILGTVGLAVFGATMIMAFKK